MEYYCHSAVVAKDTTTGRACSPWSMLLSCRHWSVTHHAARILISVVNCSGPIVGRVLHMCSTVNIVGSRRNTYTLRVDMLRDKNGVHCITYR